MRSPVETCRRSGLSAWQALERGFDAALGSRLNPLRHLGALATLAFALLAGSGSVLYIVLDTSASGAYRSIDELSRTPLSWGSLLRGLHRYSADTFALATLLHLLREWLHGHECGSRGFRRFSWLTGVPLVALAAAAAIGGFWLNWDALGQYSAIATAEWLDALPLFATPLARNFVSAATVSDRLFSLFVFVHIGVPLLLVFALWFHLQRITRAAVLPPRALAWGTSLALLALAGLAPITSHAPAAPDSMPSALRLDWMLLWLHPLADATSPAWAWALVGTAFALLFALPFVAPAAREAVAVVDPPNCNGCRRCFADCPYAAITMAPHPNQRVGKEIAVVDPDLCASCGICAGACPSSTPFRSIAALATGIDMPQRTVSALRERLNGALATANPIVVFGCDRGAQIAALDDAREVRAFSLLCTGQLPPSFVEFALRDGAAGVVVAACRDGGCEFRFGERWTRERLQGVREPHLRASVDRARIAFVHAGRGDETVLTAAIERLRHA